MRQSRPVFLPLGLGFLLAISSNGCLPKFYTPPVPSPAPTLLAAMEIDAAAPGSPPALRIEVDPDLEVVVVLAGPFRLAAADALAEHHSGGTMDESDHIVSSMRFEWPVEGWYRGYEAQIFDRHGSLLDPSMIHHLQVINFDRRQFAYPTAEKLMAVGRETGDVQLPISIGVPMSSGMRLGMQASWHNSTDADVEVFLRIILRWTPGDGRRTPTDVLPVNLDVNNVPGASSEYDLPPGPSSRSFEFAPPVDGRLLAVSGHLHQYGQTVRLEDAETGRAVVAADAIYDASGQLTGVQQKRVLGFLGRGIRLHADRAYRLIGEYRNPLPDTIRGGAMAQMVAVYAPDDWTLWPKLDASHPAYLADVRHWRLDMTSAAYNEWVANGMH